MDNKLMDFLKPKFLRKTPPYRVFFTWEIHYACNYQCTYCHAPKPWHPNVNKTVYLSADEWIKIWDEMYEKYGMCEMIISGGEPFTYPDFMDLIIKLQKKHFLEFVTNLSWDVKPFIENMNPQRVKVGTSFHPEFADFNAFIEKVKLLKKNGFDTMVNFVPWPPLLAKMVEYKQRVEDTDVPFVLQPFIGEYEGKKYPRGYTESEKEYFKIFKDECNINTLNFKTNDKLSSTTGKLCRMGENYAFIHPDGEAHRCCRDKSFSLGNLITGSFRLLDEPVECKAQECNCWRCMLVGKEEEWSRHWGRQDINKKILNFQDINGVKENNYVLSYSEQKTRQKVIDAILIQAPVWGIFDPSVALAQLSACLKQNGYKVISYDLNIKLYNNRKEEYRTAWAIEQSPFWNNKDNVLKFFQNNNTLIEGFVDEIISLSPKYVCFSVNTCSLFSTFEFARRIKERIPNIKVILGGPQFLVSLDSDMESILKNDSIDIIVFGEGEKTLIDLLDILDKGNDLNLCKGIYFKRNSKIIKTEPQPLIENLDELPFLDFSDLPLREYDPDSPLEKHISLMTSRGCIQNCVFCGPKSYWQGYRSMSGRRIYEEIKYHISHNPEIENIEFLDLLFNGNMKVLIEFCELMIAEPVKENLKWHANAIIRPQMTEEVLQKMKKAGCFHLSYGIESGSQRVLDLMNKRYKIEDADKVLKYTHEAGILVTCNFMFGFPGEKKEDFQETLEFLKRNKDYIDFAYPSRTFCTIEPYSYIAKHLDEFGMVPNAAHGQYWESKDGENSYPERMRRCENFSLLAQELGVNVGLGLQTSIEHDRWLNLGYYYESKKDYKNAIDYFYKYLTLDPKNGTIQSKIEELKIHYLSEKHTNNQISFNWDIHYVCNYRCPYCWFYNKWVDLKKQNKYFTTDQLVNFWSNIYSKYGTVKIAITGGEPFLYPDFVEVVRFISGFHKIEIITNLSINVDSFIEKVNPDNVKIHPSFHPLFADFEGFKDKVLKLKQRGFSQNVSYLAWPPHIPKIKYYYDKFSQFGINLFVQSFFGEYKGIRYPDGYSAKEKEEMSAFMGRRGDKPFQTEPLETKGKLCSAGQRYGVIHPDGQVLRCGGIDSKDSIIGNLSDEDFKLLDKPLPCASEICPCNEWAFLLEEVKQESLC